MNRTRFFSGILTLCALFLSPGPAAAGNTKTTPSQVETNGVLPYLNRIRQQTETIREKEDDAPQKIIRLLYQETEKPNRGKIRKNSSRSDSGKKTFAETATTREAVLRSWLAQALWEYYRDNAHGIAGAGNRSDLQSGRTGVAENTKNLPPEVSGILEPKNPDYSTLEYWQTDDFIGEILRNLQLSCELPLIEPNPDSLYDPRSGLAETDSLQGAYRPGLKEILTHRAWQLLVQMQDRALLQTRERIERIFRGLEEHISRNPDQYSAQALPDLKLRYLDYLRGQNLCPDSLYEKELHRLVREYGKLPNAGDIWYLLACLQKDQNPFLAEAYIDTTLSYPESRGARQCIPLQKSILSPYLNLSLASVQLPFEPMALHVEERNCAGFDYKIYPLGQEEMIAWQTGSSWEDFLRKMELNGRQSTDGHIDLPLPEEDLRLHTGTVSLPALPPGFYRLDVQFYPRYRGRKGTFPVKTMSTTLIFSVSGLGFFCYPALSDFESWNAYTLNRKTGSPLAHIGIDVFFNDYDYEKRENTLRLRYHTQSDRNGFFRVDRSAMLEDERYTRLILRFTSESDTLWTEKNQWITLLAAETAKRQGLTRNRDSVRNIFFFPNLPVYRPGDSVIVKTLTVLSGKETSLADGTKTDDFLQVVFHDPDGEIRASFRCRIDTNGIAEIAWRIPPDAKAGRWNLSAGRNEGSCSLNVENYKRPDFSVSLPEYPDLYRRDTCRITGSARYYSGEAVSDALASYRIYLADYRFGKRPGLPSHSSRGELLTQGTTRTDENGIFHIAFKPDADRAASGVFPYYEVECDLTDRSGETQTARIRLPAYSSPEISAQIPELSVSDGKRWLNGAGVIRFESNGSERTADWRNRHDRHNGHDWTNWQTRIEIFRLSDTLETSPFAPGLADLFPETDRTVAYIDEPAFRKQLPLEPFFSDRLRDSLKVSVPAEHIATFLSAEPNPDGLFPLPADMPAGCYELRVSACTPQHDTLHHRIRFYVARTGSPIASGINRNGFFIVPDTATEAILPHRQIAVVAGNPGKEPLYLRFRIEDTEGNAVESDQTIAPGCHRITLPVQGLSLNGDWSVAAFCLYEGRSFLHSFLFSTPKDDKNLKITSIELPQTAESGRETSIRLRIERPSGMGKMQPVILGMYDASLDYFGTQNTLWPLYASYTDGKANASPSALLPAFGYPVNRWTSALFSDRTAYSLYTSREPVSPYYAASRFPEFGARLKWNGTRAFRFENELIHFQYESTADYAGTASGSMRKAVAGDERTDFKEELRTEPLPELPRRHFRPDVFFTLAPCIPDDSGYRVDFRFKAPEYFGRFKLRAFAYSDRLYAGFFQQELTVNKAVMLYPSLPRFLREHDSVVLKCRYIVSRESFPKMQHARADMQVRIYAIPTRQTGEPVDRSKTADRVRPAAENKRSMEGGSRILFDETFRFPIREAQNHIETPIRIPAHTDRVAVEYVIRIIDPQSGLLLASDAMQDTVAVRPDRMSIDEFLPFFVRRGEAAQWVSSFHLPPDSLTLSFQGYPELVAPELLRDMRFDSCKTSLDALLKLKAYYLSGRDWQSVWPVLADFATREGGFSWIRNGRSSYDLSLQIMKDLGELPPQELLALPQMKAIARKALHFLSVRIQEDFRRDTGLPSFRKISDDKIAYLYLLSAWHSAVPDVRTQKASLYYEQRARAEFASLSLYNQALLLRHYIAEGNTEAAETVLANLDRLALYDAQWGMYWKRESLGAGFGERLSCMANIAKAYREFAVFAARTEAWQYREILNWMLTMQQTADFRPGYGTGIGKRELIDMASAILPAIPIPERTNGTKQEESVLQDSTTIPLSTSVSVEIGKVRFEIDSCPFKAVTAYPQTKSFKNKMRIEWPADAADAAGQGQAGSSSRKSVSGVPSRGKTGVTGRRAGSPEDIFFASSQIGYGSLKASSIRDMSRIEPSIQSQGLRIVRTYRDLNATDAREVPSRNGMRLKTGSRIQVTLAIYADRDFSYVRIRSPRPAGLDWVNTRSGYEFENGLALYRDVDDWGTDYFIEFLPKGRYLIRYELKADTEGCFTDEPATVECTFGSGFGAHSGSGLFEVAAE